MAYLPNEDVSIVYSFSVELDEIASRREAITGLFILIIVSMVLLG